MGNRGSAGLEAINRFLGCSSGPVEIGGSALLALSRQARGVESTKRRQRHERGYHTLWIEAAWENVTASFERFCLAAGVAPLAEMMECDIVELYGPRYGCSAGRRAHRWGRTAGKLGFHGGKVSTEWPRASLASVPASRRCDIECL